MARTNRPRPLVLCILGLALYPQLILKRTDDSVQQSVAAANHEPALRSFLHPASVDLSGAPKIAIDSSK